MADFSEQPKSLLIESESGDSLPRSISKRLSRISWSSAVKGKDRQQAAKQSDRTSGEEQRKPWFAPRKPAFIQSGGCPNDALAADVDGSDGVGAADRPDGGWGYRRRSAAKAQGGSVFSGYEAEDDHCDWQEEEEEEYLWDQFSSVPMDEGEENVAEKCLQITTVVMKLVMYLLLFAVILFGLVIAKGCILSLVSRLRQTTGKRPDSFSGWVYIILIAVCAPYLVTFLQMGFKIIFGKHKWPSLPIFLWTLLLEAVHCFGLALLLFRVLPNLDVVRGLFVMSAVGITPSLLNALFGLRPARNDCKRTAFAALDVLAFLGQLSSLFTFIFLAYYNDVDGDLEQVSQAYKWATWELPISIVCASVNWRGNFYNDDLRIGSCLLRMPQVKRLVYARQVKLNFLVHGAKIGLMFGFAFALLGSDLKPANEAFASVAKLYRGYAQTVPVQGDLPTPSSMSYPSFSPIATSSMTVNTSAMGSTPTPLSNVAESTSATTPVTANVTTAASVGKARRFARDASGPTNGSRAATSTPGFITATPAGAEAGSIVVPKDVYLAWDVQWAPFIVLIIAPLLVFYLSIVSAQLHMQLIPFSLSTTLATPVAVVIAACLSYRDDRGDTLGVVGLTPTVVGSHTFILHVVLGAVWWLSQLWISRHVWVPKNIRLERVDGLFASPGYCAVLLEQCLVYNRRKDEDRWRERLKVVESEEGAVGSQASLGSADLLKENIVPMIYICATMWHENENEMLQMLKSVVRLDEDQATRKNAFTLLQLTNPDIVFTDPDYYMFEAHIFFDDAMELNDDDEWTVNSFVRLFVATCDRAASAVFNRPVELQPPVKCPTPYGGRLVWTLPGENKLIVHLKDKNKIRHRKRWSQIMYMYYLLGYELLGAVDLDALNRLKQTSRQATQRKRQQHFAKSKLFDKLPEKTIIQAENTFCLALDGDVDFRPHAVTLLVDRLKRNSKVGVVCGRIHPIGSGPMVWYQKFEYAISHWLQKAAEHVMGCVLCAPGAFSLFRGSALMDDNVMGAYVRLASEASHYVQYDQGEDRWLSTLLLQQGYRVEYVAAADALTYAPESFNEFFNQRRRWGPSTMANILDLLISWRHTIRMNDNISVPFMLYQALIFFSSLLGPATIVLMIAGAFDNVFGLTLELSYFAAVAPPVFYVIVCFFTKPNTQVSVAAVMSAIYALLMTAVLVATIAQIAQTSVFSPSGIFLLLLTAIFISSGVLHPQEFLCLAPGLLYYICIPSGYLLLIIYSMVNLNIVSWGTREVAQRKPRGAKGKAANQQQPQESVAVAKQKKGSLLANLIERQTDERSVCSNIARFFRQCCAGNNDSMISTMRNIEMKLSAVEATQRTIMEQQDQSFRQQEDHAEAPPRNHPIYRRASRTTDPADASRDRHLVSNDDDDDDAESDIYQRLERNDLINPAWIEEECLKKSPVNFLAKSEIEFWDKFIAKHLKPLDHNTEHEKKIANDLKTLRNNVCFAFFMVNAIWIALIFVIQLKADSLKPLFIEYTTSHGLQKNLQIEPIGLAFLSVFGITIIMQYLAMLWHRWSTMRHILATTNIEAPSVCCREGAIGASLGEEKDEKQIIREAQQITRGIQRAELNDDDDEEEEGGSCPDNFVPTTAPDDPSTKQLSDRGASSKISGRQSVGMKRKTQKRLSLRRRFEKQLHKLQAEPANDKTALQKSLSHGMGPARSAPGGGSSHLSVQLQRLSSMRPKRHHHRAQGLESHEMAMRTPTKAAEDLV